MSYSKPADKSKKRKEITRPTGDSPATSKRQRPEAKQANTPALIAPHEVIITRLKPKFDLLAASVISSTQIRNRVTAVVNHLLQHGDTAAITPPIALLHARPADTCKLITISEQCKRLLKEQGRACYQYNQLFELPLELRKTDVVEKTVVDPKDHGGDSQDDDDDGAFEVMESRFEKALLPEPPRKVVKALRVFLAPLAVPELRAEPGMTVQISEPKQ